MGRIQRVCLYGGSGAGKSTMASKVFSELKTLGTSVELVTEYVKTWAYQGRFPKSHEQLYVFAKQQHREDELLGHVDVLVSDSPLLMNAAYSQVYGFVGSPEIIALSNKFEADYPGLHFWLGRRHEYRQEGRYQTLDEAKAIDEVIQRLMKENLPGDRMFFECDSAEQIVTIVRNMIPDGI